VQDGTAQVGTAQDGTAQEGTAQVGTAQRFLCGKRNGNQFRYGFRCLKSEYHFAKIRFKFHAHFLSAGKILSSESGNPMRA